MILAESALLCAWEQGLDTTPAVRALTLLKACLPEMPSQAVAELSIGDRDALLLSLRELAFGDRLVSTVRCPGCATRLEIEMTMNQVRVAKAEKSPETFCITLAGYSVRFRLPRSSDLLDITPGCSIEQARQQIFERCLQEVHRGESEVTASELPEAVATDVAGVMAKADPQADISVETTCANCAHTFSVLFDAGTFLWSEVDAWARRTLRDVHTLASAYGWNEDEILALSPRRRAFYLQMATE